jgi:glyoxylase-like metal-dependent hydrolase (beta-lactamase superfamily II)
MLSRGPAGSRAPTIVSGVTAPVDDPSAPWWAPGVFEVAPGVHRIPLPLPDASHLHAVNVYAIAEGNGFVLIDSGWAMISAREQLERALGLLGGGFADVTRFLMTHLHRDHYTLGVALRREFGNRLSLGRGEVDSIRLAAKPGRLRFERQLDQLRRCGADELVAQLGQQAIQLDPEDGWEDPDEWIDAPADIALASRTLRAVATPGHTRGHLVYVDGARQLLFAGDHVLPHITPSIGFEPVPTNHALRDYLSSLRLVRAMPDATLLPAHGPVLPAVWPRVDELLAHHEHRLDAVEEVAVAGASTAYDAARRLSWTRRERDFTELDVFNQMLATVETAAHLDVLVDLRRLRVEEIDGVAHYDTVLG